MAGENEKYTNEKKEQNGETTGRTKEWKTVREKEDRKIEQIERKIKKRKNEK